MGNAKADNCFMLETGQKKVKNYCQSEKFAVQINLTYIVVIWFAGYMYEAWKPADSEIDRFWRSLKKTGCEENLG